MAENDWSRWKKLVLSLLERLENTTDGLRSDLTALQQAQALLDQELKSVKEGSSDTDEHTIKRLEKIEEHVTSLRLGRAMLYGGAVVLGMISSVATAILIKFME